MAAPGYELAYNLAKGRIDRELDFVTHFDVLRSAAVFPRSSVRRNCLNMLWLFFFFLGAVNAITN